MRLEIDVRQLQAKLDGLSERNIRFATAKAVNETAKRVQQQAVTNVRQTFTLRDSTRQFLERQAAIIKPFAKAADPKPFAEVAVGQARRLLLAEFEKGATRRPFTPGAKSVAVPITGSPARPTFSARVPNELLLKNLRLQPRLTQTQKRTLREATRGLKGRQRQAFIKANAEQLGVGGQRQLVGRQRTFVIRGVGVLQRVGPKEVRLLYKYDRDGQLSANLGFLASAQASGNAFLREEMERAIAFEISENERRAVLKGYK